MLQWLYRFLAIGGLLAIVFELTLLVNPRQKAPGETEWENHETDRFMIQKPKRWRAVSLQDSTGVGFYRGLGTQTLRTGFEVFLESPLLPSGTPSPGATGLQMDAAADPVRRAHDGFVFNLRNSQEQFKAIKTSRTSIARQSAIMTEYQYVIPHPIPFFAISIRGFCITFMVGVPPNAQVVHFNAFCPEDSYPDMQATFQQMIASFQIKM